MTNIKPHYYKSSLLCRRLVLVLYNIVVDKTFPIATLDGAGITVDYNRLSMSLITDIDC